MGQFVQHARPDLRYGPMALRSGSTSPPTRDLDEVFDGWMTRQSRHQNTALVATYDFSPLRRGGHRRRRGPYAGCHPRCPPSVRGILLDLPQLTAHVPALDEGGVRDRCHVMDGKLA